MAFPFTINGYPLNGRTLPALKYQGASYSRQAVDSSSTGRNQNGRMIRDLVASKDKWQLEFTPCKQEQLGELLGILDGEKFTFTYPDPLYGSGLAGHTNKIREAEFYCGDRSAPVFLLEQNSSDGSGDRIVGLWGNFKVNVIEL